jgi:ketosteroid isomerase-like protein
MRDEGQQARWAAEVREVVDRETRAWDTQDVELLLGVFHPDMVWPWPTGPDGHDPIGWEMPMGRFDRARWSAVYAELFATHRLVRNMRVTRRVAVTPEGDGAFAVVDVDTLWERADGTPFHWRGRACKVYARVGEGWKMTMHTGLLDYPPAPAGNG